MAQKDPNAVAAKWAANLAGSTASITSGVAGVTVAPGQAAARNKAGYVAGVTRKADEWARLTAAVPLPEWQRAMTEKGIPRIASGATQAQPKFQAFMTKLLPFQHQLASTLPARGTLDQNLQRMDKFVRGMAAFTKG